MEIIKPDEYDIETEMDDIIPNGATKPIARESNIKYWRLRAMLRSEDSTTNVIYEAAMLIYGALRHDRRIAKRIFNILYRLALSWGLIDQEPLDIIESSIEKLKSIGKKQLEQMSPEQRFAVQGFAGELEEEANRLKMDAIRAKYIGVTNARQFVEPR
jgi:hypothetical protein